MLSAGVSKECNEVTRVFAVIIAIIWLVTDVAVVGADQTDEAYIAEVNEWHAGRVDRLRSEKGYLSLIGLFKLNEGKNSFGTHRDADIVFDGKVPVIGGAVVIKDGAAFIEVEPGAEILRADEPVASGDTMLFDGETTELTMGTVSFYVIQRGNQLYVRARDSQSKLLRDFDFDALSRNRYPIDRRWRIEAKWEPYDPPKSITVPNILGYEDTEECEGAAVFELEGKTYRIDPMNASNGRYWFVFGDETSGVETYGGGRFLYFDPPDENGVVYLDFNKSYTPPCAFSPHTTCPLPVDSHVLAVKVDAGEKNIK